MSPRKTQKRKVAKKPKHAIEAHAPKSLFRTKKHKVAKKPKHAVDVPAPKLPSRTKTRKVAKMPKHAIETPAPKSLLGLPPELRNRIHRFAVSDDNMITITKSTAFPNRLFSSLARPFAKKQLAFTIWRTTSASQWSRGTHLFIYSWHRKIKPCEIHITSAFWEGNSRW
jgi:hypothetical protein